jgi:hypothetical protein
MNVTRSNIGWIAVRAIGIFFVYKFAVNILDFVSWFIAYTKTRNMVEWGEVEASYQTTKTLSMVITYAGYLLVNGALAFYFLRRGEFVHSLLLYRTDDSET